MRQATREASAMDWAQTVEEIAEIGARLRALADSHRAAMSAQDMRLINAIQVEIARLQDVQRRLVDSTARKPPRMTGLPVQR